jgi:hypothetical protein
LSLNAFVQRRNHRVSCWPRTFCVLFTFNFLAQYYERLASWAVLKSLKTSKAIGSLCKGAKKEPDVYPGSFTRLAELNGQPKIQPLGHALAHPFFSWQSFFSSDLQSFLSSDLHSFFSQHSVLGAFASCLALQHFSPAWAEAIPSDSTLKTAKTNVNFFILVPFQWVFSIFVLNYLSE